MGGSLDEDLERAGAGPFDAEGMVERYDRVIAHQEAALERMRGLQSKLPDATQQIVEDRDIQPLRALIDEFRARRTFWVRKLGEDEAR